MLRGSFMHLSAGPFSDAVVGNGRVRLPSVLCRHLILTIRFDQRIRHLDRHPVVRGKVVSPAVFVRNFHSEHRCPFHAMPLFFYT